MTCLTLLLGIRAPAAAQVYLTKEEALRQYFPNTEAERKTIFLTDAQVQRVQTISRTKVDSKLLTYYVGRKDTGPTGYAFFDTHVVRTMPETFMVVVNPDSTVRAVEVLAFYEPEDYLPPKGWLSQFEKKSLRNDLWLKRGVPSIVGATLSAQSMTDAVRRILALYEVAVTKEE